MDAMSCKTMLMILPVVMCYLSSVQAEIDNPASPVTNVEKIRATRATGAQIMQEIKMSDSNGVVKTVSVEEACLTAHNKVRALHTDTPPLVYDAQLASEAADWALRLTAMGRLQHSADTQYGENLYADVTRSSPFDAPTAASPAQAVYAWYSESFEYMPYDYNDEMNSGRATSEFTQVVWKSTTKVGCGVAFIDDGYNYMHTYIVARYDVAGNMYGDYVANVKPMKSDAQRPPSPGDLDKESGGANYGLKNCDYFKNYIESSCQCTCG